MHTHMHNTQSVVCQRSA